MGLNEDRENIEASALETVRTIGKDPGGYSILERSLAIIAYQLCRVVSDEGIPGLSVSLDTVGVCERLDKIDGVIEILQSIDQTISQVPGEIPRNASGSENLRGGLDGVTFQIESVCSELSTLNDTLGGLDGRLSDLEKHMCSIDSNLSSIDSAITALDSTISLRD